MSDVGERADRRLGGPKWDLFPLFSVVARTGSINRAADELGMSEPTLSRRLKELERYVGAPLFFRVSSGVRLTQEGKDLQRSTSAMITAFEGLHEDLRSRVGQRAQLVRISATEGLTKHWLLPRIERLRKLHSSLQLELFATVQQQNVSSNDLDIVIRMGDPHENDLVGKRVGAITFGIYSSEKYLAKRPAPRSLSELPDHDLIGVTADVPSIQSELSGEVELFAQFFDASRLGSAVRISPIINHFSAAAEGLGLALLPVPFAAAEGLVRVLPEHSAALSIWLLRRRESDLRKMTRDVHLFLEREFAKSREWLAGEQTKAAAQN
ncbi:LysR family transcriptional regulator [Bradyrhizobium ivorense]|uniref:LysR family transcriptional regulator n=1 Tax=Bradyrhizobium ivorense TaxID=2511166 RepID=UPI001E59884A|nr:LysR family transcriptional regulator [Bradyrhizobium ivorense]